MPDRCTEVPAQIAFADAEAVTTGGGFTERIIELEFAVVEERHVPPVIVTLQVMTSPVVSVVVVNVFELLLWTEIKFFLKL